MSRFLLVHGRHGGAWCWEYLVPALRARGHAAIAIDLPGQGDDSTPAREVTARATVDRIVQALEPTTILVGHSLGGFWCHRAAGEAPDLVERMVYLATLVARKGESWAETAERYPGSVIDNTRIDEEQQAILPPPDYTDAVYNRCPAGDVEKALARLRPLPLQSLLEAGMAPEPYDPHPSSLAIVCVDDRVQPPSVVEPSAQTAGVPVIQMAGDHSSFFSEVDALAGVLDDIARGAAGTGSA